MNPNTCLATTDCRAPQSAEASAAQTRDRERHAVPAVDIFEKEGALHVVADMPGVSAEGLNVRVENGVLTIEGKAAVEAIGEPVREEFRLANYFRSFQLGDEVDVEKIEATLKNGVLTARLPKAEKAQPRKIEVKVG